LVTSGGVDNQSRPHRALVLRAPDLVTVRVARGDPITGVRVQRHDLVGGLIRKHELASAA
jgi:hypothetical protein